MTAVSAAGGTAGMAVLALIGAGLLWRMGRRAEAGIVIGAAVGAELLVQGFKHLYGRARPPVIDRLTVATNFALPSGHALVSIVVLGVLAAVAVLLSHRLAVQAGAVALAIAGTVTIGVSRLYLGVHWVTDVLTGWLLGGAWLALCVTTLVLIQRRPQPAPASTPAPSADATTRGDGDGAAIPIGPARWDSADAFRDADAVRDDDVPRMRTAVHRQHPARHDPRPRACCYFSCGPPGWLMSPGGSACPPGPSALSGCSPPGSAVPAVPLSGGSAWPGGSAWSSGPAGSATPGVSGVSPGSGWSAVGFTLDDAGGAGAGVLAEATPAPSTAAARATAAPAASRVGLSFTS
jgi:hypothetical protein